jgi:hypothetical protein
MTDTQTNPAGYKNETKPCGCGEHHHHGHHKHDCCCKLECFERPNYFCGHLLTDADLKLDQKYVIEKNKLYHRAIHGHGVVCGLRLTCDPHCEGTILVGDGYAIDQCGNDLVVCEPRRVVIVENPPDKEDDCEKPEYKPDCTIRKCYYVAICYDEEQAEYTTPFKANCGSGPSACEPTRVHETVRFKVLHKLPDEKSALDRIEHRIKRCFKILTEGDFSDLLHQHSLNQDHAGNPCDTFCKLKVYFKHWLKKYPDPLNCCLCDELNTLDCPKDGDAGAVKAAYDSLLKLVHTYIYDCMRAELVFCCDEPECGSCIVLGTVEVVDGKICRICTCHRQYLWTIANFLEVLLYEVLVGSSCKSTSAGSSFTNRHGDEKEPVHECCPGTDILLDRFLLLFSKDRNSGALAATSLIQAMRFGGAAVTRAFQHTDPDVVSMRVFENLPFPAAQELAKQLNVDLQRATPEQTKLDAITSLLPSFLQRSGDRVFALPGEKDNDSVRVAVPQLRAPLPAQDFSAEVTNLRNEIATLKDRLDKMQPPANPA